MLCPCMLMILAIYATNPNQLHAGVSNNQTKNTTNIYTSSTLIPTHLSGINPAGTALTGNTLSARGGNQTLACPADFASSLPLLLIFISATITLKKLEFSLGSLCLGIPNTLTSSSSS